MIHLLAQQIQTPTDTLNIVVAALGGAACVIIGALGAYIRQLLKERGEIGNAHTAVEVSIENSKAESIKRENDLQNFVVRWAENLRQQVEKNATDMAQLMQEQRLAETKVANLTGQAEAAIRRADSADTRLADAIKQIGASEATNKAQAKTIDELRDARRAQEGVNTVQTTKIRELTESLTQTLELQNSVIKDRDLAMSERNNAVKEVAQLKATVAQLEGQNAAQAEKIKVLERRVEELQSDISALRANEAHLERKVTATLPNLPT